MGVHFVVVCDNARELLNPDPLFGDGKASSLVGRFSHLVLWAMLYRWHAPARLVADASEEDGILGYRDVTEEVHVAFLDQDRGKSERPCWPEEAG